jgi:hypothetical protein
MYIVFFEFFYSDSYSILLHIIMAQIVESNAWILSSVHYGGRG